MRNKDYLILFLILLVTTICSLVLFRVGVGKENVLMVFLVGILLVSAFTRGYRFGIVASCVSVIVFNYFFTEPLHTLAITRRNDMVLMIFFLVASVISSSLTVRFQRQLLISQKNEMTARLLYEVSQSFLKVTDESNIVRQGIRCIKEHIGIDSAVDLIENKQTYYSDNFVPDDSQRVIELPIMGLARVLGTLRLYNRDGSLSTEQEWLVNTVAVQMGIALDREFVYNEREKIRIAMEREHLKSNLLRSIGHDLRTPLTGIVGASSYINERSEKLDRESIKRLSGDINEQAVWLTALVENILNMTRIDSGKLEINKQVEVVDDVVNEAITHVVGLSARSFKISLPSEVIAVPMDGKMIVQVLVNLLDNAVNHTPKGSSIELIVSKKDCCIEFNVADSGRGIDPSIEDKLFNAFVTSGKAAFDGKKGIGLGLAICKAVVEAHGGTISTGTSTLGGALFTFTLPFGEDE